MNVRVFFYLNNIAHVCCFAVLPKVLIFDYPNSPLGHDAVTKHCSSFPKSSLLQPIIQGLSVEAFLDELFSLQGLLRWDSVC